MIGRRLLALLCAVLLPAPAAAENIVEVLPTMQPMPARVMEENIYAFEDLSAYYDGCDTYEQPALTESELARLPEIRRRREAGERPERSVLNLTAQVRVSLIRLPMEQYEGESWFLFLPGREMTDAELLELTDAFGQLGLFPETADIGWHNCMRGGAVEGLRSLREEEQERYASVGDLFIRSGLRPEIPFTDSVLDDGLGRVTLDDRDYGGVESWSFLPARRLTDEELLRLYALQNEEPSASPVELAGYERKLRIQLHNILGMPLSAQRSDEEAVTQNGPGSAYGDLRTEYYMTFREVGDGNRVWYGGIDTDTGLLMEGNVTVNDRYFSDHTLISDVRLDPWDSHWVDLALKTVSARRQDHGEGLTAEAWCESMLDSLYCAEVRVRAGDGGVYRVRMAYVLDEVMEIWYNDARSMACEENYYLHDMMQEVFENE